MKPDSWLPFYGNDFFAAIAGYDEMVLSAYIRALWHYWHHFHCSGVPDDNEYMRRMCHCEVQCWARVKGVIFSGEPFFELCEGKWHQLNAHRLYQDAVELYAKRQNQTEAATRARLEREMKRNESRSDSRNVDLTTTTTTTPSKEGVDGAGAPPPPTPKNKFEKPTVEEMKAHAFQIGMPEKEGEQAWHFYESKGWKVGDQPMKSWKSALITWRGKWQDRGGNALGCPPARFGPQMGEVVALAKEKWPQDNRSANWGVSFWKYWEKRGWKRANGDSIDWKVEFSKQVSAWRTTSEQPSKIL